MTQTSVIIIDAGGAPVVGCHLCNQEATTERQTATPSSIETVQLCDSHAAAFDAERQIDAIVNEVLADMHEHGYEYATRRWRNRRDTAVLVAVDAAIQQQRADAARLDGIGYPANPGGLCGWHPGATGGEVLTALPVADDEIPF
jgi:hypothetical protein